MSALANNKKPNRRLIFARSQAAMPSARTPANDEASSTRARVQVSSRGGGRRANLHSNFHLEAQARI